MKRTYFILFLFAFSLSSYSQENKLSETILSIAEDLAADESDPEAVAAFIDRLHELAGNPININSADEEKLSELFFLSDFQIKALADYSHSSGKIYSVYEVANIPGFDRESAEMLIPFIRLETLNEAQKPPGKNKHSLLTNLSFIPGNTDTISQGSQLKLLSKYRFTSGGFSGGFSVEKDPGERFFYGNPPGPDFASAYISWKGKGFLRKLVIGDFSAKLGQGINVNTGMRTGLSLTSIGYTSAANEVREYTSTDENNFFRGVAAAFSLKRLSMILYYSRNNIDATTGSFTGTNIDHAESLYTSGLHNTSSMQLKRDAVTETSAGINLSWNFTKTRVGIILSDEQLSLPLIKESVKPEDFNDFSGDRSGSYSFYYNTVVSKLILFGELSLDNSSDYAVVQGLTMRVSDRLTVNSVYRNYQPGYYSMHGRGPGSSSSGWNEKGITGNFTFEAAKHLFVSAGAEVRHYPWLRYRNSAPSRGIRQEIRIKYLPAENFTAEALFDYRMSMADTAAGTGVPQQKELKSNSLKISLKYSPSENLTLGMRADYKLVNSTGGRGMLVSEDASYRFRKIPLTLWFRYCLFNTGNWDSRIYTYENDLLYSFSVPALSGEGSRSYFMVKYDLGDRIDMRFKYGITSVRKEKDVSDKEEIKVQFRILF
jgi:hypothetical protein